MKIIIALFYILICKTLCAQPGGGGGVQIMNIFVRDSDWGLKTISKKDTSLKITAYYLTLTKNKEIKAITLNTALNKNDQYNFANKVFTHVYLPPDYYKDGKINPTPDQRLELIYKGDTMTLDFFDILPQNGSGRTDKIDSLIFYPRSYFTCYRNIDTKISRYYPGTSTGNMIRQGELDSIRLFMRMGITDHAMRGLEKYDLIQTFHHKPVMTIFWRQGNYDTLWLRSFPITGLKLKNISIKSNKINIKTDDDPVQLNNEFVYKFYLWFTPTLHLPEQNEDAKKVNLFFQQLKFSKLEINGQPFTGTIKWLTPFRTIWHGGVNLSIHTFKEGLLINEEIRYDVDPNRENTLKRPTRN